MKQKERLHNVKELTLNMSDGALLYAFIRQPVGKPLGHIHLLHGMAEHIGRYDTAIEYFIEQGYTVSGHDHRGHGKTAHLNGIKGHFADQDGFNRVVEDTQEVISHMKTYQWPLKFILLGHSMGSFIARRYIQEYGDTIDLVVLSGTGDDSGFARYAGQIIAYTMGKKDGFQEQNELLDSLVFGGFNQGISNPKTKFDWISKNDALVSSYLADENCGFIPTTQFFVDLFAGLGIIHCKKEIARIPKNLPILLFAGTEDPVGRNGNALWKVAKQYDNAQIKDVTVQLFEGGRHELLSDSTRKEVIHAVQDWIEKR